MDIISIGKSATASAPAPAAAPVANAAAALPAPAAPTETKAAVPPPAPMASAAQVAQALQGINKAVQSWAADLEFSVDEASDRTVVRVVDQQTGEIIRQMPTKEALEIAKALDKMQGMLLRQKA